jgi:cytochrome c-type biogenesis protein CcmH/NrfG
MTISPEARALAISAVDHQLDAETRRLTTKIRTDVNDPSVQLLLAEIVVRLGRIEQALAGQRRTDATQKSSDKKRRLAATRVTAHPQA